MLAIAVLLHSAMTDAALTPIEIGLTAAIVAVEEEEPAILVAGDGGKGEARAGLPFGPFDPLAHRTFEIGLRAWVEAQTALAVGYVEQLYTFGDRGRHARPATPARTWSRSAISRSPACRRTSRRCAPPAPASSRGIASSRGRIGASGRPDDPRQGHPAVARAMGGAAPQAEPARALGRRERLRLCFGVGGSPWDEEKVLDRYELLYEAGLVGRRGATAATALARGHFPRWASRCASITGASSRPRSRGCAPSSNIVPSSSS